MKKFLSLVLALCMLLSLSAAALAEETLTMLQRLPASYIVEDNPVIEAWGDMYGINIEIEAPPISSYNDRRNVVMASGDLPDLIYVGDTGALYTQWAREGLLLDLTPYLNETYMPNASKVLTQEELFNVTVQNEDGTSGIYSLPRVQTKPWDCILYRGDWLEKLGLEVPTTPEEFAEVMIAFATQDPDGNGKNDTYGWTLNTGLAAEHRNLITGFGILPTEVPNENGEYTVMFAQPAYQQYLDWCREQYAAGAMDPEFYLIKAYEDEDMFYAGKIGVLYSTIIEHLITRNNETFKAANPDGWIVAGPSLKPAGAEKSDVYYAPQIWGNYAISADCDNIELALKVLDGGYTDAVNELLVFGLEGVTYTEFDAERRYASKTDEQLENANKWCATYATINYQTADKGLLIANGSTEEEINLFSEAYDRIGTQVTRIPYLNGTSVPGYGDVDLQIVESGIGDEWTEMRTKYITGEIDREAMDKFLTEKLIPAYQPLVDLYANYNNGQGFNK